MFSFFQVEISLKNNSIKPFIHSPYAKNENDAIELTEKTFKKEYGYILKVINSNREEIKEENLLFSLDSLK